MKWNEVVSTLRQGIRRRLGRGEGAVVPVSQAVPERLGGAPVAVPAVDVYENESELVVVADVPGGSREGAVVSWEQGRGLTLLVQGPEPPGGTVWTAEYGPHDWYRALDLPEYADAARATSTIKDGVLTIRIPKRAAATKRIRVQAG
ncbi:MAG: Hsp20/alpha crystallin family protein [Myxococcales bacterium]|nr:Hsp20/alpha crystallin family protein [Myxococcota bacterium]MDW8282224.1 Hsp20/alpha crystallin family protein [Myxococcales bacterium]